MKEFKGAPFYASQSSVLNVNGDDVATVCGIGLSADEDDELAILFSAAPNLLSVLQEVLNAQILPEYHAKKAKALGELQ